MIDDEPSIVRALAQLLRRAGYMVETASQGRQALAHLQRQRYDVIVTDLRMPVLDGRAFYTCLQQDPALCQRVIFLMGESSAAETRAFLAQCGRPWLTKPCTMAALRRTIQQVLRNAGADAAAPPAEEGTAG